MAIEIARRTRTSLNGGLSWARARPNRVQHVLVRLHHGGRVGLADGVHLGQAGEPDDVALPGAERGETGGRVRRREDDVLVEVRAALVEVVPVPGEHRPHLAGVLLQDERAGADEALLEIAVLLPNVGPESGMSRAELGGRQGPLSARRPWAGR
jgi:hypothetical protein